MVKVNRKLYPMKQFSKKIGEEECIRKNQCPTDDSPKTNLNFFPLGGFLDSKHLLTGHSALQQPFCK